MQWKNRNASDVWVDKSGNQLIRLKPDVELLFESFKVQSHNSSRRQRKYCSVIESFLPTAYPPCPLQAQTNAAFMAYASNIQYFYANFSKAYKKMTEFTYTENITLADIGTSLNRNYPVTI